jgi:hypothetical protein
MTVSALKELEVFAKICGQKAMPNVVIVSTMWSEVKGDNGKRREQELRRDFWKDMVTYGCRIERFRDSHKSAWHIIGSLSRKKPTSVLLSHEIVDEHLRLNETEAGIALNKEMEKLIKDRKEASRRLREQAQNQNNVLVVQELNRRQAEIEDKIQQTADQLRAMKIPFTRRVRLFFMGRG